MLSCGTGPRLVRFEFAVTPTPTPLNPIPAPRLLLAFHTFGQSYMHVPALLARTGLPVDAVITSGHPLSHVRNLSQTYFADASGWTTAVENRLLTGKYALLLNVDEPGLIALYRHPWHPDAIRYLPFAPGSDSAATVGSKRAFHEWCLRSGLPVPETQICPGIEEAMALQQRLPGDWLLKGDSGSGGQTIMRAAPDARRASHSRQSTWLVQQDEGRDVGSGIFLAERGRLLAWMGIKKVVCLNDGLGPTVLGRCDTAADVGELCRRVAAASEVTGLTGFDFVRSPVRGPLLIDSHLGRMSPMQHFDRLYNVDFAAALRSLLLEGNSREAAAPTQGPAFIKFPEVLQLVIQGGLGNLLRESSQPVAMPLAPPGDPLAGLRSARDVIFSETRVRIGRFRSRRFARLPVR